MKIIKCTDVKKGKKRPREGGGKNAARSSSYATFFVIVGRRHNVTATTTTTDTTTTDTITTTSRAGGREEGGRKTSSFDPNPRAGRASVQGRDDGWLTVYYDGTLSEGAPGKGGEKGGPRRRSIGATVTSGSRSSPVPANDGARARARANRPTEWENARRPAGLPAFFAPSGNHAPRRENRDGRRGRRARARSCVCV